jgi:hypothetical protein
MARLLEIGNELVECLAAAGRGCAASAKRRNFAGSRPGDRV